MSNKSIQEELRDNFYRLKLKILNERLQKEKQKSDLDATQQTESFVSTDVRQFERDLELKRINFEMDLVKRQHEKLKEKIKLQELEKRLAESALKRQNEIPDNRMENSRFNQQFEMMMLQQTQTQNLLMNQLLMKANTEKEIQFVPNYPPMYPAYGVNSPHNLPPSFMYQQIMPNSSFYPQNTSTENLPTSQPQLKPPENPPQIVIPSPKPMEIHHVYPGNQAQQDFRKLGLAALFCAILDSEYEENSVILSDKFLFNIKIQEIITSIQRYYLSVNQPIYSLLQTIVTNDSIKFRVLLTKGANGTEISQMEQQINNALIILISKISEIMPTTGTLGCESRSILSEIILTNQTFPDNYFYAREIDLIQIDSTNTVRNLGIIEAKLILIGIFYLRALVVTILMKPTEYGLVKNLSAVGKDNLLILSSIIVRIYRIILAEYIVQKYPNDGNKKKTIAGSFTELNSSLLTDEEIEPMTKYIKKTIDNYKLVIYKWVDSYVMKMRPA